MIIMMVLNRSADCGGPSTKETIDTPDSDGKDLRILETIRLAHTMRRAERDADTTLASAVAK
jgi:hypothetical protein